MAEGDAPSHWPPTQTPAEARVAEAMSRVLTPESGWRSALLLCTYRRPGTSDRDVSMTHAIGMQTPLAALDVVMMVRRLRLLADELEAFLPGAGPLPKTEGEPTP